MKKLFLVIFFALNILPFFSISPAMCQEFIHEITATQGVLLDGVETRTKERINGIVAALENYALDNEGLYPENFDDLMGQDPPYLMPDNYEAGLDGYQFSLDVGLDGYTVIATPVQCGVTGEKIFIQERGKALIEQDCDKNTL